MIETKLFKTRTGEFHLPVDAPNCGMCTEIIEGGVYDKEIVDALLYYIRPHSTVVDAGACYGQMSVIFSRMVGPSGSVVAIEANHDLYEIVLKNIVENQCPVRSAGEGAVLHAAAWDVGGIDLLFPNADIKNTPYQCYGCWGLAMKSSLGYHKVKSLAIDDLHLDNVSAIKIDVQGADLRALRGCVDTIRRCKPVIVYEYEPQFSEELGCKEEEYAEFVKDIGYVVKAEVKPRNYLIMPK